MASLSLVHRGAGRGALDRLDQRPAQRPRALLGDPAADHLGVGLIVPRGQPGPRAQPGRVPEPGDVADLGDDDRAQHRPDAGQLLDRAVAVVPGQQVGGHLLQHGDLAGQPADQLPQRGDLPGVRLGQRQLIQPGRTPRRRRCPSRSPRCRAWPAPRGPGPCSWCGCCTSLLRYLVISRSSRISGGAIHASASRPIRSRSARSRASSSSFLTRRWLKAFTPSGCARCTSAPAAASVSAAQYQP